MSENNNDIPVMIVLLRDMLKCNRFGFHNGHPIREAIRDLIRIEQPVLRAKIERARQERDVRNRKTKKPIQLRLW